MTKTTPEQNKALVLESPPTRAMQLKRDYAGAGAILVRPLHPAQRPYRAGAGALVPDLVRLLPQTLRYENQLILAEGDYVVAHGRFSNIGRPAAWIAADIARIEDGKLAEHWDVRRTRRSRPNPRVACRCLASAFHPDRLAPTEVVELVDDSEPDARKTGRLLAAAGYAPVTSTYLWRTVMRAMEAKTFSGYGGLRQTELPKPQPAKDRIAGSRRGHAGVTRSIPRSSRVRTRIPKRRWCSATRARVSSRMPATPVSRSEAA